ncbi:hypothetical protein [Acinetobacter sp. Marseille-Q1623]|uniref:hypothetical protein n=1 Tax=Acinetobacter sp. Marseille-Q1623 TaxID=2697501 RepID=UPI001E481CE2|nr:hypothetical protein [Acinetobacter sp. Marseille-Q1623]
MKNIIAMIMLGGVGFTTFSHAAANTTLDLTPYLQDRFENNCAVRSDYDLHKATIKDQEIVQILKKQVTKEEFEEHQTYTKTIYTLKNTVYQGLTVKKIEFSWGKSRTLSEFLYFDLSTPAAKQQFNKIKWNKNQQAEGAGLVIAKDGKLTTVQCYWSEVFH